MACARMSGRTRTRSTFPTSSMSARHGAWWGTLCSLRTSPRLRCSTGPLGLGSYAYDAHTVQRVVQTRAGGGARAVNEGEIMSQPPCYLPQRAQLSNVLAAVPVSASHVVFTSLRMEPTWMIMGHAAGAAAALAGSAGCAVQDVSVAQLQALLVAQGQIIAE